MWINQPGRAYGPGSKGRVGRNGGARGGWSVAPARPAKPAPGGGWHAVPQAPLPVRTASHPVPPGFGGTQVQSPEESLHQLVKNVNLQAAMQRIRQMTSKTRSGALTPQMRPPGGIADWISNERAQAAKAAQLQAGFAANPTLAPTVDSGVGAIDPMNPMGIVGGNLSGGPQIDPYAPGPNSTDLVGPYLAQQQQAAAQRAAMVARLVAQGRIQ